MLTPIFAVKTSLPNLPAAAAETAAAAQPQPRGAISVSPLQSDVVSKIVDTLSRHFLGKDVLPPEALARLVETLAHILKVPPLPNETTMEFARRLAAIVETMPPEVRQLAEKQLGLRALGIPTKALAEALRNPNGTDAARIVTVLETAPQPATGTGARAAVAVIQQQAGPQMQLSAVLAAALASPVAEVEALQSVLKRAFGEEESARAQTRGADIRQENPAHVATGQTPDDIQEEPLKQDKLHMQASQSSTNTVRISPETRNDPSVSIRNAPAEAPLPEEETEQAAAERPALRQNSRQDATFPDPSKSMAKSETAGATTTLPAIDRPVSDGRGLADVLARLSGETVDELTEKLTKTLHDVGASPLPPDEAEAAAKVLRRTVQTPVGQSSQSTPMQTEPDGTVDIAAPAKPVSHGLAAEPGPVAADERETAAGQARVLPGLEEARRDMALPARGGEQVVMREVIPFAMLHYLPATAEAVSEPEDNNPAFGREESEEDNQGDEEQPETADEDNPEDAPAPPHPVLDAEPDNDTADDAAYEAYVRMGGIF